VLVVVQGQEAKAAVHLDLVTQQQAVVMVAVDKKAAKAAVQVVAADLETVAVEAVAVLVAKEITVHQEPVSPDKDVGVAVAAVQHKADLDQTFGQTHQDQVVTAELG
jgi:hypothetical protein